MTAEPRYYTTPEVCKVLGLRTRQTLYNWGAQPDAQAPGERGVLLWSKATVDALAEAHGRTPDWSVTT